MKIFFTNVSTKSSQDFHLKIVVFLTYQKNKFHPIFARFIPADDTRYDAVIFRDADSILGL